MTNETTLVAGFLIGTFCGLAGAGLLWYVRSEWSEKKAKKAERIISSPPVFELTEAQKAAVREHMERRIDMLRMAVDAERLADPETILFAVPEQRDPRDTAYDHKERGL